MLNEDQHARKELLLCELHRQDGQDNFNNKKYPKALRAYTQALRHASDDVKSLVGRSKCYSKLRYLRKACDDVDLALNLNAMDKAALLQKGDILDQLGNQEMALVYYYRGAKRFPRSYEFKEGISRVEKRSNRKGRGMKITATGDLSLFTAAHKSQSPRQFQWKNKPVEKVKKSLVPSANFRSRLLVHPLANIHKKPGVLLNESRATSLNSLLSGSLESLPYEDKLLKETTEKAILGKMYADKEYLEFLLDHEAFKNTQTPRGACSVTDVAESGLFFLQERTQFWDTLGPLPPPHPSRISNSQLTSNKSRLSQYTSTESLQSLATYDSTLSVGSYNASKFGKAGSKPYRSRYAYTKRKEKPTPPKPEKVDFDFASYRRDEDLREREMTLIPEEVESRKETEEEYEHLRNEALKRGEETTAFVEKEIAEIDKYFYRGRHGVCKKRAEDCIAVLGRFSQDEVPTKNILLSTLYSCLGNCDMQMRDLAGALENHGQDLLIGEQTNNTDIQSRALGNLGRVHVLMGKYNRALDIYNRKAPLCKTSKETAWLFHEIGNCFLMMNIFEYAHESGLKSLRSAHEAENHRLQLQSSVLVAVAEVNLVKYKDAYQHFEMALDQAKLLNDKRAQDTMTRALVDVNKKMVAQLKKKKQAAKDMRGASVHYKVPSATPMSRATPISVVSASSTVTVEG